jgi:hypothetical protein
MTVKKNQTQLSRDVVPSACSGQCSDSVTQVMTVRGMLWSSPILTHTLILLQSCTIKDCACSQPNMELVSSCAFCLSNNTFVSADVGVQLQRGSLSPSSFNRLCQSLQHPWCHSYLTRRQCWCSNCSFGSGCHRRPCSDVLGFDVENAGRVS